MNKRSSSARRSGWANKLSILSLVTASIFSSACGYSQEEMDSKQREVEKLSAELKAAKGQIASDQARYNEAQADLDKLRGDLKTVGKDQQQLQQALAEYKQRAEQLAAIEARFRQLRDKLQRLTNFGLKVEVRNNRMVIQLPGDILFDSGKDELRKQGSDVLQQVADIIRADKDLNGRSFQVAGHTDNAKYTSGPFKDNWGLSLMRARTVLLFLVEPAKPGKDGKVVGGGLSPQRWSAVGYGETDPVAGTTDKQTKDEMTKNRRVELVVQPNVDEMLNLNNIK